MEAGKGKHAPHSDGEDALNDVVAPDVIFGPEPVRTICPKCSTLVWTRVEKENSILAWVAGGLLCMCGCVLWCHLLPCLLDRFKDVQHDCPNCEAFLSSSRRCHRGEHTILALAELYFLCVSWLTAFTGTITHDRVPDIDKYPPLPNTLCNLSTYKFYFLAHKTMALNLVLMNDT